jgi:peptide/nickel transport system permease protein
MPQTAAESPGRRAADHATTRLGYVSYVAQRLGSALLVLFILSILVFLMVRLIPGDPLAGYFDTHGTPTEFEIAQLRARLGLDRPWHIQYFSWLGGILSGDIGDSLIKPFSVGHQISARLPYSLELALLATAIALAVGIPAGVVSGRRAGRLPDAAIRTLVMVAISVPSFLVGLAVVLANSRTLKFKLIGARPFAEDPGQNLLLMIAPATTLALPFAGTVVRYLRAAMIDELEKPYRITRSAKGLTDSEIAYGHALRNAIIPVTTVISVRLATLVGGTVVIENVFSIPGMGQFLIESIQSADYPSIQGAILVIASVYLLMSLIVDLLYPVIDPRIRGA